VRAKRMMYAVAAILFVAALMAGRVTGQSAAGNSTATYTVRNLGTLGGVTSVGDTINDLGWVMGNSDPAGDTTTRAALWAYGLQFDLGTLGGANSVVEFPIQNNFGLIAGISETAELDPLNENWSCAGFFPTAPPDHHICLGFVKYGLGPMLPLPTLGGVNGYASGANNLGQVAGWAETPVHDSTCAFPQILQFEAVVYEPDLRARELPPLPGDLDGAATDINDLGQVIGISGICDNAVGAYTAKHMVLWENGQPTRIPDFGGKGWNTPWQINDRGEVVGFADKAGDVIDGVLTANPIAFVWSKEKGRQEIKPLPEDTNSIAYGINNLGQVVGQSFGGPEGSRAFLWQNGKSYDLNELVTSNANLYLMYAQGINDRGEIVGQACVVTDGACATPGAGPGYLAVPSGVWSGGAAADSTAAIAADAGGDKPRVTVPREMVQRSLARLGMSRSEAETK
jgi:probable HAF family extracellular repeat protein